MHINAISRMQEVGANEALGTPSDLTECAVEDAAKRIIEKISEPTYYVLTVCPADKDEAMEFVDGPIYPPPSVVVSDDYKLDEWTLKGVCGDESYCIWSPGA